MYQPRLTRITALALVVGAMAAPAASAQPPDMHASTALAAAEAQKHQDLRSADARDAAFNAQTKQDLRSPDAVDAAAGRGTFTAPDIVVVKVKDPQPQPVAQGLDWGDAAIGAGALVGLAVIALGGTLVVTQRRQTRAAFH